MPEYFYHLLPDDMKGKDLLPLSQLEINYPDLAKEYKKSYKGREKILNKKIPILDCVWKDVIFLSCVNPELIFAALEFLGILNKPTPKIIKFPISCLNDKNACLYKEDGNKDKFNKLNIDKYKEENKLSIETLKYFMKSVNDGGDPLIFSGVSHILLNGSLPISKGKIFKYEPFVKENK